MVPSWAEDSQFWDLRGEWDILAVKVPYRLGLDVYIQVLYTIMHLRN